MVPLGCGIVITFIIGPNGHLAILMPQRMFLITSAKADLEGSDLVQPTRSKENPSIEDVPLPARPTFAVGRGYFKVQDPIEYEKTIKELHENRPHDSTWHTPSKHSPFHKAKEVMWRA